MPRKQIYSHILYIRDRQTFKGGGSQQNVGVQFIRQIQFFKELGPQGRRKVSNIGEAPNKLVP